MGDKEKILSGITNMSVMCDEPGCGWSLAIPHELISDWHNQPCPKCGKGVIVNDDDMSVYNMTVGLMHMSAALDPNDEMPKETVRFNTQHLRGDCNGS